MRLSVLAACLGISSTFLAACGGEGAETTGPSYADSVSTAAATEFGTRAAGFTALAVGQLNFGVGIDQYDPPFVKRPISLTIAGRELSRAMLDGECLQTVHGYGGGAPIDADANGIADDMSWSLKCTLVDPDSDPDTVRTYRSYWEGSMKQDATALHGYTGSVLFRNRVTDEFGNEQNNGYEYSEDLDLRSNTATYRYSSLEWEGEKRDGVSTSSEVGGADSVTFTPTGTITLGAPLPSGTLTFHGRDHQLDSEGANLSFSLATTTPLAYNAACFAADSLPPFTAGAITGMLNNDATQASFTATFSDCGTPPEIVVTGAYAGPPSLIARH